MTENNPTAQRAMQNRRMKLQQQSVVGKISVQGKTIARAKTIGKGKGKNNYKGNDHWQRQRQKRLQGQRLGQRKKQPLKVAKLRL